MKKWVTLLSLVILMTAGSVWGSEIKKIAVLPFSIAGSESMDYLRSGILAMLTSRLNVEGQIEVLDEAAVQELIDLVHKKELGQSDVYVVGQKLGVDYVVWGSIKKDPEATLIDGRVLDMAQNAVPVVTSIRSIGQDDIIPKVNDFARRIDQHILGEVPATFDVFASAALLPTVKSIPARGGAQRESSAQDGALALNALRSKTGTLTSVANSKSVASEKLRTDEPGPVATPPAGPNPPLMTVPDKTTDVVKTAPTPVPANRPDVDRKTKPAVTPAQPVETSWSSQKLDARVVGLAVGDIDRDGQNEIVCIDAHHLFIYRKVGEELNLLKTISVGDDIQLLAVDVADINGAGVPQIFLSAVSKGVGKSQVLSFANGKYARLASDLPWLMRVAKLSGKPTLLGQTLGAAESPFNTPVVEMKWDGKSYGAAQTLKLPKAYGIYDMTMGTLDAGGERRIVALDRTDTLCVYQLNDTLIEKIKGFLVSRSLLWKSTGTFGGTANSFGTERNQTSSGTIQTYLNYVNIRMFLFESLDKTKRGLTLARNIASAGLVFGNEKIYLSGEIVDLEWSGKAFKDTGRRIKLDGYVADMQVCDLNSDGHSELVVAVVGAANSEVPGKTTLIVYPMDNKKYLSGD